VGAQSHGVAGRIGWLVGCIGWLAGCNGWCAGEMAAAAGYIAVAVKCTRQKNPVAGACTAVITGLHA